MHVLLYYETVQVGSFEEVLTVLLTSHKIDLPNKYVEAGGKVGTNNELFGQSEHRIIVWLGGIQSALLKTITIIHILRPGIALVFRFFGLF